MSLKANSKPSFTRRKRRSRSTRSSAGERPSCSRKLRIDAAEIKSRVRAALEELIAEYGGPSHGIEIRQVAGGYRMSTKPEQHDVVRAFAKSLKPPIPAVAAGARNSGRHRLQAAGHGARDQRNSRRRFRRRHRHLLDRKLITTAGRKPSSAVPFSTRPARNSCCASG
jgi:segregation and condensation protein B